MLGFVYLAQTRMVLVPSGVYGGGGGGGSGGGDAEPRMLRRKRGDALGYVGGTDAVSEARAAFCQPSFNLPSPSRLGVLRFLSFFPRATCEIFGSNRIQLLSLPPSLVSSSPLLHPRFLSITFWSLLTARQAAEKHLARTSGIGACL